MKIADRYEVIEKLGEGGMGEVHLALDLQTGEVVAVKIAYIWQARDREAMSERFTREIEILSAIHHPNIVAFRDSGTTDEYMFYVMEFIPGRPIGKIGDYLRSVRQIIQIAGALLEIHEKGIIHRDIKPSNILVSEDTAKLLDFGIAHVVDSSTLLTKSGTFIGTAEYMSPEQLMCSGLDERSDIYALGAVLYEILTGRPPFQAQDIVSLIHKVIQERPENPSEVDTTVPKALEAICLKMLEKRPERRYQSVRELLVDLVNFLEGVAPTQKLSFNYVSREAPFVGRGDILSSFSQMLSNLINGSGQSLEVFGGVGSGKTRTLAELQSISLSRYVKFIACDTNIAEPGIPVISTLLNSLADYDFYFDIDFILAHSQLVRSLSPKLADKLNLPSDSPTQNEGGQAPYIIADMLLKAFPDNPVVYAFESNVDAFTQKVIEILTTGNEFSKVLVVVASLQKLDVGFSKSLELAPFTDEEMSQLAQKFLGRPIEMDEIESLSSRTGGNPQFVFALIRESRNQSKTITVTTLPESLSELLSQKMVAITGISRVLLNKMALLANPMSIHDLQLAVGFDDESMKLAIQKLFDEGLVIERLAGSEYVVEISSGALSEVIVGTINKPEMPQLHQQLAVALEAIDKKKYAFSIGSHFIDAGQIDRGAEYIGSVVSETYLLQQFHQALFYANRLIPLLDKITDQTLQHKCFFICTRTLINTGKLEEAGKIIELYRNHISEPGITNLQKVSFYQCLIASSQGARNYEAQLKYAQEAEKLFDRTIPNSMKSTIYHDYASAYINMSLPDKGIPFAVKALELAGSSTERYTSKNILSIGYSKLRKFDDAIRLQQEIIDEARQANQVHYELVSQLNISSFYTAIGRIEDSAALIKDVLEKSLIHHYDIFTANAYMKAIINNNVLFNVKDNRTLIDDCITFFERRNLKTNFVHVLQQSAILALMDKNMVKFQSSYSRLMLEAQTLKLRAYIVVCYILKADEMIERQSWQELIDFLGKAEEEFGKLMPGQTMDDFYVLMHSSLATAYSNLGMLEKAKNHLRQARNIISKDKKECDMSWVDTLFRHANIEVGIFDSLQGQTMRGSFFTRQYDETPKRLVQDVWVKTLADINELIKHIDESLTLKFFFKPRLISQYGRHIYNKIRLDPNSPDRSELANKALMALNDILGYLEDNDLEWYRSQLKQTSRNITYSIIRKRF